MSNRPAGRRLRYVSDIKNRYGSRQGGWMVLVELQPMSGKYKEDWYPGGDVRVAIASARADYPGCRIARVQEMDWCWWIILLEDHDWP